MEPIVTVKILALERFLDGRDAFEEGRVYELEVRRARRVEKAGWATRVPADTPVYRRPSWFARLLIRLGVKHG